MKITVIGSFVMDMVARVGDFPQEGQTILGKSLGVFPGGKGVNQCVAAARLGAETEMIGMLGKDGNGDTFRRILKEENIISDKVFSCDLPTAIAQIQISDAGENKIVVIPSANYAFSEKELAQIHEEIMSSGLVMLQLELELGVTYKIIDFCYEKGIPVMLNPAPAVPLSGEILAKLDYITPNETELQILTGISVDSDEGVYEAADKLLALGVKNVVATLGKRGALIANKDGKRIISGYSVKAVDTVAAGDSFNGALARCLMQGISLDDGVRFANAVGALTVTKQGAIPSLPTLAEVEAFIKKNQ